MKHLSKKGCFFLQVPKFVTFENAGFEDILYPVSTAL
jgi:hypothetical protein